MYIKSKRRRNKKQQTTYWLKGPLNNGLFISIFDHFRYVCAWFCCQFRLAFIEWKQSRPHEKSSLFITIQLHILTSQMELCAGVFSFDVCVFVFIYGLWCFFVDLINLPNVNQLRQKWIKSTRFRCRMKIHLAAVNCDAHFEMALIASATYDALIQRNKFNVTNYFCVDDLRAIIRRRR